MSRFAGVLALACLVSTTVLAAMPAHYQVEAELTVADQLQRLAPLRTPAHESNVLWSDGQWRLSLSVNPLDDPYAPSIALWVTVLLEDFSEGHWQAINESVLGGPASQWLTVSVPEQSLQLRLRVMADPDQ